VSDSFTRKEVKVLSNKDGSQILEEKGLYHMMRAITNCYYEIPTEAAATVAVYVYVYV
jgi:hypothetical protein